MDSLQSIKQRFGIIGNNLGLNRALEKSMRVSGTDISVLVIGESGVGKENIPKIIHQYSHRKHSKYIAVNCGAIPEGTIDSELFGHEKGAFTGATQTRLGYFEVADGGTIFLDEVGELPLPTQVRLLRVLETGEFIKVGSSIAQKTNVRIVAATNVNMMDAIQKGKFREDLYYRLSTVEITLPPLRDRKEDIVLLFRKFASDFAQKYQMPTLRLDEHAQALLKEYRWNGNIRQLRNVAEQLSVLEKERNINAAMIRMYLPDNGSKTPALMGKKASESDFSSEREILYKVLFDMKNDLNDLKKLTLDLMNNETSEVVQEKNQGLIDKIYGKETDRKEEEMSSSYEALPFQAETSDISQLEAMDKYSYAETIEEEEPLSLQAKEIEMIKQALIRSNGKRKLASKELGISERTLYRKIKQYDLNDLEKE
ncbi:sigma-54 dependent transcriptional regulator [Flavobacteriaceae bacterium]|nr:sigma-54 dependent transcriptional regulator [Flavobacteriaceae bacterium]MDB4063534.1 sigma-54 dependent transcriptional regulator [Flavobacteriaceae bacterium]MDB4255754.1 sigma-54 dependent transcriptional regulator [Flavobacteriaceae bacterium]MDC0001174.1 sigma-54 dependent transcriptional regulator [Flavobacteriaceae bacterium]|tara:strand:- start:217 stop:1494 length:1278 start_codon:yes stop_codon:yes gene_type:complete